MPSGAALLDPAFLHELEVLRRRLDVRARSGGVGERATSRRGGSAEFQDHRPYAPGDDPRRIDWSVMARTGEAFIKLFRAEEDAVVRLLVDASASMRFGDPEKLGVAKKLAAGLGYMALRRQERAQLWITSAERARPSSPVRGRAGVAPLLEALSSLEADGSAELSRAIDAVVRTSPRPGMLAIFSDFFDPGPVLASLSRARAAGHAVCLVQIVSPEEEEPELEGDLCLVDAETQAEVELTADADALDAYAARFRGLCEELRGFARGRGASYVRARTDAALEDVIRRVVDRAVDG
ncbi:MAG: DUF58 domain-containing protein [Polyangiaceae bacterium]|nr:DUF58 domain-containing protein [Polyangiaceae bacterium]